MRKDHVTATLMAAAALGVASASAQPDPANDQAPYLAGTCGTCHGTLGQSAGATPSLAGADKSYLIDRMKQFRDGKRPATIMHQLAKGYSDRDIELLAEHFSGQPRPK